MVHNPATPTYIGFSTVANDGSLDTRLYDKELVKQDLMNHFNIRLGELPMRPDLGSIIWDLLAEPFDDRTESAVVSEVRRIVSYDPRVTPVDIRVEASRKDQSIGISVELHYVELGIQDFFNMVFRQ